MTKEALDKYEELQDEFQMRCEIVCDILRPLNDSYNYVYDFKINGNIVYGEGTEYWSYGGERDHYAEFPKEYLCMDDDEIFKIVDAELKRRADEESRKRTAVEQMKVEKEKAEYERLKKIYG